MEQAAGVEAEGEAGAFLDDILAREQADDARALRHDVHVTQAHGAELAVSAAEASVAVDHKGVALHEASHVERHVLDVFVGESTRHFSRARSFEWDLLELFEELVSLDRVGKQLFVSLRSLARFGDE